MYILDTRFGHTPSGKPILVSDQYGRMLVYQGNAVEVTDPTPAQARAEQIAELRAIANRKTKGPAKNACLTKSQILALYRGRNFQGAPMAYGKAHIIK